MLAILLTAVLQGTPILCPVMGVECVASAGRYDYGGVRIGFCCLACRNAFEADPAEVLKAASEKGWIYGETPFDPVDGKRLDLKKVRLDSADHKGIRYAFGSEANRRTFLAQPEKFAKRPAKEATFCFGGKKDMKSYAKAIGFADFEGVRYYQCCAGCEATFKKDPAAYAKVAADAVHTVEAYAVEREEKLEVGSWK